MRGPIASKTVLIKTVLIKTVLIKTGLIKTGLIETVPIGWTRSVPAPDCGSIHESAGRQLGVDRLFGGRREAVELLQRERAEAPLHASEITRLEVLAGMRPPEEDATRKLLGTLIWHQVDTPVAEQAGALGRRWLPRHHIIGSADLAIAATAMHSGLRLLTRNIQHFPMFEGLGAPY